MMLNSVCRKYGPVIRLGIAGDYLCIINDKELIRQILKTDYIKFPRGSTPDDIKFLLGNGIFASEHELWSARRKLPKPAFNSRIYPEPEEVLRNELEKTAEKFHKNADEDILFEPESEFQQLFFRATLKNLFTGEIRSDLSDIIEALNKILSYAKMLGHTFRTIRKEYIILSGLKEYKNERVLNAGRMIDDFTDRILKTALEKPAECGTCLSILLNEFYDHRISREDIDDEMKNIILAGYYTTASTLTWLMYAVSTHEDTGRWVLQKINNSGRRDYQNISRLEYSKILIKETLRLYPPAWVFHRINTEEFKASGYLIPANSWLFISPFMIHRNSEYWYNHDEFNPERFKDESSSETIRFDFMPFGNGPHVCIGNSLAIFQLLYSLSYLIPLFRFDFRDKKVNRFTNSTGLKAFKPLKYKI